MRSKNILSIAAFIIAFLFSAFIASLFIPLPQVLPVDYSVGNTSYSKPTSCFMRRNNITLGDKMTDFIIKDERNGNNRIGNNLDWDDPATFANYAESVEEYVDVSSSMNANAFPGDFQTAWRKHMKAWRDYSNYLNKTAANMDDSDISREDFIKFDKFYGNEIDRTYKEFLRIADNYGAEVR